MCFPLSSFAPENLVSRKRGPTVPSRTSPPILHSQAESGAHSPRDSSHCPRRRPHNNVLSTAIGSTPSVSGHTNAYRWRSLSKVHSVWRHRVSSPQGSSSNGCCIFRLPHPWTNFYAPLFFHAANGQDSWGFFKNAQGFGRLDAGSRAGFTSSRPPPPWTSVFRFSLFLYKCVALRNLDLLIKTGWSVIFPVFC